MKLEVSRNSLSICARSFELFAHTLGHLHAPGRDANGTRVFHLGRLEVVYSPISAALVAQEVTK